MGVPVEFVGILFFELFILILAVCIPIEVKVN